MAPVSRSERPSLRHPPGLITAAARIDGAWHHGRRYVQRTAGRVAGGYALIVFSDGVSEALNPSGDFFGDERIGAVIQGAAGEPAAEIGDRLLQALQAFVGDAQPHDDVSLMVLRCVNHA